MSAALDIRCPDCGSPAGRACVKLSGSARSWSVRPDGGLDGQTKAKPHADRVRIARAGLTVGLCPEHGPFVDRPSLVEGAMLGCPDCHAERRRAQP